MTALDKVKRFSSASKPYVIGTVIIGAGLVGGYWGYFDALNKPSSQEIATNNFVAQEIYDVADMIGQSGSNGQAFVLADYSQGTMDAIKSCVPKIYGGDKYAVINGNVGLLSQSKSGTAVEACLKEAATKMMAPKPQASPLLNALSQCFWDTLGAAFLLLVVPNETKKVLRNWKAPRPDVT